MLCLSGISSADLTETFAAGKQLLSPLRTCTAASNGVSVQYAPLWSHTMHGTFEDEFFFRSNSKVQKYGARPGPKDLAASTDSEKDPHAAPQAPMQVFMDAIRKQRQQGNEGNEGGGVASPSTDSENLVTAKDGASPVTTDPAAQFPLSKLLTVPQEDVALWQSGGNLGTLCMDPSECADYGFVSSSSEEAKGYDEFMPPPPPSDGPSPCFVDAVALDCEMVMARSAGSVLARATLVRAPTGEVLIDTYVKPQEEVVDYVTKYSGITAEILEPIQTTLKDVQAELKRYISTNTIVIGHSLENDFKACGMKVNCKIVDTAQQYPHPAGLPAKNSLRYLALVHLGARIQ